MSDVLVAYLSRYIHISPDLERIFRENNFVRTFPKGAVLLRPEDRAREAYFILKGCVRSYVVKDGEERTVDFFIEEDAVLPLGYGKDVPSGHYLECLEETTAVVSDPDRERKTISEYPELKSVCLAMSEIMAEKLQESLARYRTSTPEERYRDLIQRRPDLVQRIPQYQIAGYLGVRPESLSRIRKRLARPRNPGGISDRS